MSATLRAERDDLMRRRYAQAECPACDQVAHAFGCPLVARLDEIEREMACDHWYGGAGVCVRCGDSAWRSA